MNELDPVKNQINNDNLAKFLSDHDYNYLERQRQKGPEYLIIDNFAEYFQLEKSDLVLARMEAE